MRTSVVFAIFQPDLVGLRRQTIRRRLPCLCRSWLLAGAPVCCSRPHWSEGDQREKLIVRRSELVLAKFSAGAAFACRIGSGARLSADFRGCSLVGASPEQLGESKRERERVEETERAVVKIENPMIGFSLLMVNVSMIN
ncbi:hypothetical protein H5410_055299 [Solanum commersonii]|uniref:Uncharacterized protein n=1 Tax=Solanum commersonii TaxID=4109 RepID=A0A9J5WIA7_SOLCO|nr:hypothetical protein H5410_055299 [Solanum commersonii]